MSKWQMTRNILRLRRLSQHRAEAQPASADPQLGKIEQIHYCLVNDRTGQDDIRPAGGQASDLFSLLERQAPEVLDVPPHALATQSGSLDTRAVVIVEPCLHAGQ